MAGLVGKTISSTYKSLLRIADDSNGVDTSLGVITDGEGTESALNLSDDNVKIIPKNDDTTSTFTVSNNSDSPIFIVDSTNSVVKAGASSTNVLTQYAYFGITAGSSASYAADTHQAIPFMTSGHSHLTYPPTFGTGTDPATTFTTSDDNTTRASDLVPVLWHIPDAISIDSVTSIEGADTATGETTGMHLFSYTFNSGSTSALSAGTLLAHSPGQVNSGSEQAYKNTWTVDSGGASIASGKVILAFFESVSTINSDYSLSVVVKYHII